jgi:ABC-type antimicrobial peptide transport system permease subunit
MFRNFITVSFRTLSRNKFHTFINVVGLAIGVSACLLIYLIVSYELSFNKDLSDYSNIYRIHSKFSGVFSGLNRGAPTAIAPYIRENFTGVEKVSIFFCFGSKVEIPTNSEKIKFDKQKAVAIASPDYFDVIGPYKWISGSPEVLTKPKQVVLTQSQAKLYFGDIALQLVIGKEIIYRDSLSTQVAGIVEDLPFHTDFEFTDFISEATIEASWLKKNYPMDDWTSTNSGTQVFVKALPNTDIKILEEQLPLLSKIYKEKSSWDVENHFNLQPLSTLHYDGETGIFDFSREPAHMPTLITLILVAILLLVIAAINFINLATAQAVKRAKEVGVRKVLGSSRSRLVTQFMFEGSMVTLIAVVLALPLTELSLSFFSDFVPKGVTMDWNSIIPFLIAITLSLGILASTYPAWVLSSFLPIMALKNQAYSSSSQSRTSFLRKSLIVFQFGFAQVLIFGTIVVTRQIHFMLSKDLGFKKEAIIYFYTPWYEKAEMTLLLKNEIETIAEVEDLSLSSDAPASNSWSSNTLEYNNGTSEVKVNTYRKFGDTNYLNFYNIKLLAGKNLEYSDTVKEVLINEELMRNLGIATPEDAVGELVSFNEAKLPIVGVVNDFHMRSLHEKISPIIIANEMNNFSCLNIRLSNANDQSLESGIQKIQAAWKKIYPDTPMEYYFLDETIRNFYQTEQRVSKLINTATGLAIFISCLGLFGLASFMSTQRTKEIGIRKVLGASVYQVVTLMSKEFMVLIMIAFVIALPISLYSANSWLQGFSYHASVSVWMYVLTSVAALFIGMLTVGYQTLKTANVNPVESLRNE